MYYFHSIIYHIFCVIFFLSFLFNIIFLIFTFSSMEECRSHSLGWLQPTIFSFTKNSKNSLEKDILACSIHTFWNVFIHILKGVFHLFTAISRAFPDWKLEMNQLHETWEINKCQKPFLICRGANAECLPVLKGLFRMVFCQNTHWGFAVRPTFSAKFNGKVQPDPSSICGLCVFVCADAYSHVLLGKLSYSFISGGLKSLLLWVRIWVYQL